MISRRTFVGRSAAGLCGLSLPPTLLTLRGGGRDAPQAERRLLRRPHPPAGRRRGPRRRRRAAPDLSPTGPMGRRRGSRVRVAEGPGALRDWEELTSPTVGIQRIGLRWPGRLDATRLLLGDAWERGYGDLEWRGFVPDRVMPWYVAAWDGTLTHAYGVRTGARAFCSWQVDERGIVLWADVRSGGAPLELGARVLHVCDVVCRAGRQGESAFPGTSRLLSSDVCDGAAADRARLRQQRLAVRYAYGRNSADTVLGDALRIIVDLFAGGRQPSVRGDRRRPGSRDAGRASAGAGTWDRGNGEVSRPPWSRREVHGVRARAPVSGFDRSRRLRTRQTAGGCRERRASSIRRCPTSAPRSRPTSPVSASGASL